MAEQTSSLYVRLPPVLHRELEALARREKTSKNYEATVAIRAHVDANKQRRNSR